MILFDVVSSTQGSATSFTFSHTVTATGAKPVLVVHVAIKSNATDNVTGVTYNGVAMTRAVVNLAQQVTVYTYYLLTPATGANNIVVSCTSALNTVAFGVSYHHVNLNGATGNDSSASDTSVQFALTNSYINSLVAGIFAVRSTPATLTFDSTVTQRGTTLTEGAGVNACRAGVGDWQNGSPGVATTAGCTTGATNTINAECGMELMETRFGAFSG